MRSIVRSSLLLTLVFLFLVAYSQNLPAESNHFKRFVVAGETAGFTYRSDHRKWSDEPAPFLLDNEGVYVADVNRDYWPDVLAIGGTTPVLFVNNRGGFRKKRRFRTDATITSANFVDYDRDGWIDLVLVPREGHLVLYENQSGNFVRDEVLEVPDLMEGIGITSGDYNQDGCPDLFIIQYNDTKKYDFKQMKKRRLGFQFDSLSSDNGRRNYLLRGNCDSFERVDNSVFERTNWSLATSMADFTGDGLQDIHVANDFFRDSLYVNEGDGAFRHRYLGEATNRNGMSSSLLDVNDDRSSDIFVSNIFLEENNSIWDRSSFVSTYTVNPHGHNLLVNDPEGVFTDRAAEYGVQKAGWGWAASFADFDNDFALEGVQARQDFLIPATSLRYFRLRSSDVARFIGKYRDRKEIRGKDFGLEVFRDFYPWIGFPGFWDRNDTGFSNTKSYKAGFSRLNSRGISQIDYDRDGDLDLLFSQYDGPFVLYRNLTQERSPSSWIKIQVKNDYRGGHVTVVQDGDMRSFPLSSRSDFLSQETPFYHLGFSTDSDTVDRIGVYVNNGLGRTYRGIPTNSLLRVDRSGDTRIINFR